MSPRQCKRGDSTGDGQGDLEQDNDSAGRALTGAAEPRRGLEGRTAACCTDRWARTGGELGASGVVNTDE
ncbi:MAG TPA: hypothetical protein VI094_23430 [Propionibacteriaceae bacterium]